MSTIQASILAALLIASASYTRADETPYTRGENLLRQVAERFQAAESLTGKLTEEWQSGGKTVRSEARATLRKPNLARLDYSSSHALGLWDGKRLWHLNRDDNTFS